MRTRRRRYPKGLERRYKRTLQRLLASYHSRQQPYIDDLLKRQQTIGALATDDTGEDIEGFLASMRLLQASLMAPSAPVFERQARELLRFKNRDITSASLSVRMRLPQGVTQRLLDTWAAENSRLIKGVLEEEAQAIGSTVSRAVINGESLKQVEQSIKDVYKGSRNRIELIARTEMGNLNWAISAAQAKEADLDYYVFDTSGDSRVRPSHRAMDGKICRYDDPTVYKNDIRDARWKSRASIGGVEKHPGQDFRCRCVEIAVIED